MYVRAVSKAFGGDIGYAILVKIYGKPEGEEEAVQAGSVHRLRELPDKRQPGPRTHQHQLCGAPQSQRPHDDPPIPRGTPQNRPVGVTSKPASRARLGQL